jgi:tetratricopeptide (TPR) repeat protein
MQAEISHAIVTALAGSLAPTGGGAGGAPPPPAAAAYRLFLQGRHAWRQRRAGRLLEARAHFEGAVAADPGYAGAHAGLADVYAVLPDYGDFPPEPMYRAAEASARRALALDSTLAGPHATLGLVRQRQYRWREAEASYARALALNPSYAPARQWHGKALVMQGRVEAGLAEFERARALDPLSPVIHYNVGQTLLWNGRTAAAAAEFATALALDSTFVPARTQLAFAHATDGRGDAALAEFRRAAGPGPPSAAALAQLGYGLAVAGRRDSAAAILAGLEARARRSYVSPALLALLNVGLGQHDRALRLLERAFEQRDPDAQGLVRAPMLAPLRADPRFARLTERMRLE